MSRVLLTGDWHAGLISWGVDRSAELDKSFKQLISAARTNKIDYSIVVGDLTESFRYPGNKTFKQVSSALSMLIDVSAQSKVYILKGNHDWAGLEVYETFQPEQVCYIEEPVIIAEDIPIIAIPYRKYYQLPEGGYGELIRSLMDEDGRDAYILAAHAGAEGSLKTEPTIPLDVLGDPRIKQAFLGHIHTHSKVMSAPNAYYTGTLIRNTFGEADSKTGAWIIETGSTNRKVTDVEITSSPLVTLHYTNVGEAIADGSLRKDAERYLDKQPETMFRIIAPKPSYRLEDVADLGEKLRDKYKCSVNHGAYPFVAFDSPTVQTEAVKKAGAAVPAMIYERLSVRDLWQVWCAEKGKEESGVIGDALLEGAPVAEVWERLKAGNLAIATAVTGTPKEPVIKTEKQEKEVKKPKAKKTKIQDTPTQKKANPESGNGEVSLSDFFKDFEVHEEELANVLL